MEVEPVIWTVAGILLILAEFAVSGMVIIFFGISALVVGVAIFMGMPAGSGVPYGMFAILTILQLVILRKYFKSWFFGENVKEVLQPGQLEEYIGHKALVVEGFDSGSNHGKVEFKGAKWSATCDQPINTGDWVEITARDGISLTVKPSE